MRKFLCVSAILMFTTLSAQNDATNRLIIEKGTWYLGGNVSFGFSGSKFNGLDRDFTNESQSTNITITPTIGHAFGNNWIAALGIGYGYNRSENSSMSAGERNDYEGTGQSLSFDPMVRSYFGVGENLALYLQGQASYTKTWFDQEQSNQANLSDKNNFVFVGIRPGITFFIAPKFALETTFGSLGYTKSIIEDNAGNGIERDSLALSFSTSDLFFGLSYYF